MSSISSAKDGFDLAILILLNSTINGDSLTFSAGKPAVITATSSAYAGDQRKFNVGFSDDPNVQYSGPQWQSPNPYGTEATENCSITGKRYSIEYTQTVTGVTKGDKVYQYVFNSGSKHLNVVYMQNAGDTDNLQTVEQAIKTIAIH